jgi:hypothetical protein
VSTTATRGSGHPDVRELIIRLGVVVCVAVAAYVGAARLDDTIAVFDFRADLNASLAYRDRTYLPGQGLAGDWRVLEDARLWMPRDATYRVVEEPGVGQETQRYARFFLLGLLLPRRQVDSAKAEYAICYGCTAATLGPRFQVLSSSSGVLFGRSRS